MVSHQIIVQLRPDQGTALAEALQETLKVLAAIPDCIGYGLCPDPQRANTWLIKGDWACARAMTEHLESAALQQLLSDLSALRPYCLTFGCQIPISH
jgi:quinol monooxygenase YgiN